MASDHSSCYRLAAMVTVTATVTAMATFGVVILDRIAVIPTEVSASESRNLSILNVGLHHDEGSGDMKNLKERWELTRKHENKEQSKFQLGTLSAFWHLLETI